MKIEQAWQDKSHTGLRDAIDSRLVSPIGSREKNILAATLAWTETANPDAEDFRQGIAGLKSGASFGINEWADALEQSRAIHRINPAYTQALKSLDTHRAQSLYPRSFGDSLVTVPREFAQSIPVTPTDYALHTAWSNGCPGPVNFLRDLELSGSSSPSIGYLPTVVPELERDVPDFDLFPLSVQLSIWDNIRANRLWLSIMTMVENVGKPALQHDILHTRELMSDKDPDDKDFDSIPRPVFGSRLVRFLALGDSYDIVKKIWKEFDSACSLSSINNFVLAEAGFDGNIARLATIIPQASTLSALKTAFVGA